MDLLALGFAAQSSLYSVIIGSTFHRLVEHAPCPVLIIK